jgi:thiamine pyrophosphokinase
MSRIVIFANGLLENPDLLLKRLRPGDRIFCADGGTYHALALGLRPEMIIGDLDSLTAETVAQMEAAGVTLRRYSENKDQTDLELALDCCRGTARGNLTGHGLGGTTGSGSGQYFTFDPA